MKVAIVTPYPPKEAKHTQTTGVASYSKNLVSELNRYCDLDIVSEKVEGVLEEKNENVVVHRTWLKNASYPWDIYSEIKSIGPDVIHIQYETFIFGSMIGALEFPLLLLMLRRLKKPIVVTMHGVLPLGEIDSQFLKENWIKGRSSILRIGTRTITKIIVSLSTHVIVHEASLKDSLVQDYGCDPRKISVIEHGIETISELADSDVAKEKLDLGNKKVILFLGYITGYKNIELLISSMAYILTEDAVLVIGGGEHPRLKNDPKYQQYLQGLKELAMNVAGDRIIFKGFIPEDQLKTYLAATDVLVFPYSLCMSTSGPLVIAFSYRKPFLVSHCFDKVLPVDEIKFENDPVSLAKKIDEFFSDRGVCREKIIQYIDEMVTEKSWKTIAKTTFSLYEKVSGLPQTT